MSAGLYFTSVSFSFFGRLISAVAERNSTKIGHMVGSKCNLKTHVRNLGISKSRNPRGIRDFGKSGPRNQLFWTISQLNGKFNGLYLRNEHDIDNRSSALITTSSQNVMNFGPQTASNSTCIYPPYVNSAFHFIGRLRRRRSANGTQPHFVKRSSVGRSNNVP